MEIEDAEIEGNHFWIVVLDEIIDGGFEFFVIQSLGKGAFNRSFTIVLDPHPVTESFQKVLLAFHVIHLKKVLANGVAGAELEGLMEPGNLVGNGFFFDKDRAEVSVGGEGGYGRLIEFALVFPNPKKHVTDNGRVDFLINFECVHGFFTCGESTLRDGEGKIKG